MSVSPVTDMRRASSVRELSAVAGGHYWTMSAPPTHPLIHSHSIHSQTALFKLGSLHFSSCLLGAHTLLGCCCCAAFLLNCCSPSTTPATTCRFGSAVYVREIRSPYGWEMRFIRVPKSRSNSSPNHNKYIAHFIFNKYILSFMIRLYPFMSFPHRIV